MWETQQSHGVPAIAHFFVFSSSFKFSSPPNICADQHVWNHVIWFTNGIVAYFWDYSCLLILFFKVIFEWWIMCVYAACLRSLSTSFFLISHVFSPFSSSVDLLAPTAWQQGALHRNWKRTAGKGWQLRWWLLSSLLLRWFYYLKFISHYQVSRSF